MEKNEVIILGTIHSQHLESKDYTLKELQAILTNLKPDVILVELPVESFKDLISELKTKGQLKRDDLPNYPEYPMVILPYILHQKIKGFAFSAWSKKIVEDREQKLEEIKLDPNRKKDWETFQNASKLSEKLFQLENNTLDPAWIHTDRFDELMEIKLSAFNQLFNEELQEGGWDNINNAHFKKIDAVLTQNQNKGLRIVITIGAGHKGWMKRKLEKRDDINFINLLDAL